MFEDDFDKDTGLDLTPLIDVVFMLLIFFIMTTTFSKPVLDIVLPASQNSVQHERQSNELLISVNFEGQIFHGNAEIGLPELEALIVQNPGLVLNLFIDEKAPFAAFVSIVDMAKEKSNGRFIISTKNREEERQ